MSKSFKKTVVALALGGSMLQWWGCNGGWGGGLGILRPVAGIVGPLIPYLATEFLLDNDASPAGIDLFEDGVTAPAGDET